MAFVIKAAVPDLAARVLECVGAKTMYGGKRIAADDTAYIFSSESSGGRGLLARGAVTEATAVPRPPGVARWTPRVDVTVALTDDARQPLGRAELKALAQFGDGLPETELNFKLYRQATDKVVGVSLAVVALLESFF